MKVFIVLNFSKFEFFYNLLLDLIYNKKIRMWKWTIFITQYVQGKEDKCPS